MGLAIASYYPVPSSAASLFRRKRSFVVVFHQSSRRAIHRQVDEDFTSWWRSSLSYLRYYSLEPGDTWFNSPSTQSGWRLLRRVDTTQLNNLFTINPTTVLSVRYGFNRFPNFDYNSSQGFNVGALGMSPSYANSIYPAVAEFPQIVMTSLYGFGDSGDWDYYDEASHNFSVSRGQIHRTP